MVRQIPQKYIREWKRTHERQENKRRKAAGQQEIRRESPGEHKSNEAIGGKMKS